MHRAGVQESRSVRPREPPVRRLCEPTSATICGRGTWPVAPARVAQRQSAWGGMSQVGSACWA